MALILAVARRVVEGDAHVRANAWTGWRPTHMLGVTVAGKALGLIGFGRIAQAVARRVHFGFNMAVHVFSPRLSASPHDFPINICASLEILLQSCYFVSLHCPSNQTTRHLINRDRLRQMQTNARLINTARGNIIDEAALLDALRTGVIRGAGLDVYEREPQVLPGLLVLSNIVLLPHLGSATIETRVAMGMGVLRNLDAFFSGQAIPDRIA